MTIRYLKSVLRVLACATLLLLVSEPLNWVATASADVPAASPGKGKDTGIEQVAVALAVLLGICIAMGLSILLVRVILPGLAGLADRSLERLGTRRLFTQGVLPLVGAGLIISGASQVMGETVAQILGLLLGLPLLLAVLIGLLGAIPHVGARALGGGGERSPLARHLAGALVIGFPLLLWPFVPALGLIVTLLLTGWCAGIGVHSVLGRAPGQETNAEGQEPT